MSADGQLHGVGALQMRQEPGRTAGLLCGLLMKTPNDFGAHKKLTQWSKGHRHFFLLFF